MDFVTVLVPAHYQVLFSRLGPFDRQALDDLVYQGREFTEQWAHEASIIPVATWPLLRRRMETHIARPWGFDQIMARHGAYVDVVLGEIRRRGPLSAADMPDPDHTDRRLPGAWYGSVPRAVLEACFGRGELAVVGRRTNFARVFDLAERALPVECFTRQADAHESERTLLRQAARALGLGTAADLADYFRMSVASARPRLEELAEAGDLRRVQVERWREPAYIHQAARVPPRVDACALISPFDPLVWFRPRLARLFNFDYRFEIFVPAPRRRWGAYVLPFLHGDRLVARVDLKADRPRGRLVVQGANIEEGIDEEDVTPALAGELRLMATWLGLDQVQVARKGSFARSLRARVDSL